MTVKPSGNLPTTEWSLISIVRRGDESERRIALGQIFTTYRPALIVHIRYQWRVSAPAAEDLVEDFVLDKLIVSDLISRAQRGMGRFRNYLLKSLNNYTSSRKSTGKYPFRERGRVDTETEDPPASIEDEPVSAGDIQWMRQIMATTLKCMRLETRQSDRTDLWLVFVERVYKLKKGLEPKPYEDLIDNCGYESPTQASNRLMTAVRMFNRILRTVIADYEDDPDRIEEEIIFFKIVLRRAGKA